MHCVWKHVFASGQSASLWQNSSGVLNDECLLGASTRVSAPNCYLILIAERRDPDLDEPVADHRENDGRRSRRYALAADLVEAQ
jgi:hypothetical protein